MADTLTIKRGETFSRISSYNLPTGTYTAYSNARLPDGSLITVTVTPSTVVSTGITEDTAFVLSIDESIVYQLPIGKLKCDIFFRKDGANVATPTFYIDVIENQTVPPLE